MVLWQVALSVAAAAYSPTSLAIASVWFCGMRQDMVDATAPPAKRATKTLLFIQGDDKLFLQLGRTPQQRQRLRVYSLAACFFDSRGRA